MNVWRLKLNSAERGKDPREFCFEKELLGVGWELPNRIGSLEGEHGWNTYYEAANDHYKIKNRDKGWWPALNAIYNRMKINDLVWARWGGEYRLGRVAGEWHYSDEGCHHLANINNVRKCEWYEAGTEDSVPGGVARRLHMGSTVQRVDDESIESYSKLRYNELSGHNRYEATIGEVELVKWLSAYDLEDLVGLYLQVVEGYRIVPSTCRSTTPGYEFAMVHEDTWKPAFLQVKSGKARLPASDYASLAGKGRVFLFAAGEYYGHDTVENVSIIKKNDLLSFAYERRSLLPKTITLWMDFFEARKG